MPCKSVCFCDCVGNACAVHCFFNLLFHDFPMLNAIPLTLRHGRWYRWRWGEESSPQLNLKTRRHWRVQLRHAATDTITCMDLIDALFHTCTSYIICLCKFNVVFFDWCFDLSKDVLWLELRFSQLPFRFSAVSPGWRVSSFSQAPFVCLVNKSRQRWKHVWMGSQQDCATTLTTMEPTLWSTATRICWTFSESLATRSTFSIRDFSTNYCNLRMLYCNSQDGCHPVKFDFDVKEIAVEPSIGGKNPSERCKLNDVWQCVMIFFSSILESNTSCCKLWWGLLGPKWPQSEKSTLHGTTAALHKKKGLKRQGPQDATGSLPTIGCSHEDRGFSEENIWFAGWLAPSKRYCKHFSWWWKFHLLWVLTLFQIGEWLLPDLSRHELFFWIDCCCMPEIRARSPFCWCSGYVWQYSMEVRWSDDFVFLQHLESCDMRLFICYR